MARMGGKYKLFFGYIKGFNVRRIDVLTWVLNKQINK